jgi:hypothetical protein
MSRSKKQADANTQLPSIGRVVWYMHPHPTMPDQPPIPCPGLIAKVDEIMNPTSKINVMVFHPGGPLGSDTKLYEDITYGTDNGCWQWPVYQPPLAVTPDSPTE